MKSILLALMLILPANAFAQDVASDVPPETSAATSAATPAETPLIEEPATLPATEAVAELMILDAAGIDPDDFLWDMRIVAVMADSPNDPAFQRQMREIAERPGDLMMRDVVVLVDSDRRSDSLLRQRLRPRGFMVAIIEKDGEIKQRRPAPRSVREIGDMIDRFPLRRQELLERLPAGR